MSDSIDRETVEQVARLACIDLPASRVDETAKQLAEILEYVGQLEQVSLPDDVEPFFGATESVNAIRKDELSPSVARPDILSNAPDSDGEFYQVPPVF
ncbi:MAG: Asp-tRNA(Asn)/Glu-tRNA(Gln) amidotransferase subunit GatC [Mariniblastus sp.]|nr:Asp-tRNA(Asn)/Glu-tRNA(Gln) amidotransferase subunit GatC [Mariniblastus sp.]